MALAGIIIKKDAKGNPLEATFNLKNHPEIEDSLDHLLIEEGKKDDFFTYEEVQKELYSKHGIIKKEK